MKIRIIIELQKQAPTQEMELYPLCIGFKINAVKSE